MERTMQQTIQILARQDKEIKISFWSSVIVFTFVGYIFGWLIGVIGFLIALVIIGFIMGKQGSEIK